VPRYPNFLILGANKAGTTSLHDYLGQHPDIFMSPVKEPSYFTKAGTEDVDPEHLGPIHRRTQQQVTRTLDDYLSLFEGVQEESAVGEASTAYLASEVAPERIRTAIPAAKLVAVLRNPVERAFSAFAMHVQWGVETRSFADAVAAEIEGGSQNRLGTHYVATGLYGQQLRRYLERFKHDQLRIYLYEDLVAEPADLMRDLYGFLGVDDAFQPDMTVRRNVTRPPTRLDRLPAPVRRARSMIPASIRHRLQGRLRVDLDYDDATRRQLIERYRADILDTAGQIDHDLSSWLV
jgi:hypothetical protein